MPPRVFFDSNQLLVQAERAASPRLDRGLADEGHRRAAVSAWPKAPNIGR